MFPFCRLSQRSMLLQQMEDHPGDREPEKTRQMQEADAAHKRNVILLNVSFDAYQSSAIKSNLGRSKEVYLTFGCNKPVFMLF